MSQRTFDKVIALCREEYVTLGGGEPTLHKRFQSYLLSAIAECEGVYVITNGTVEKTALLLAKLAKAEVIGAQLSFDKYHDKSMISPAVQDIFHALKLDKDVSRVLSTLDECCCDDLFFAPTGNVYTCGCKAIKLGSVHDLGIQDKIVEYQSFSDYENPCGKDFKTEWNSRSSNL